jgi:protein-S-isoprenylcysteine O-methyltransferase Ste14
MTQIRSQAEHIPEGPPTTRTNDTTKTNARSLGTMVVRLWAILFLVQAVALFAAAGTLGYWQAWLYLGVHLVSTTLTNAYLLQRAPELLRRRFAGDEKGETERVHKLIQAAVRLVALGILVVAGLDRRFGWSAVPPVVVVGAALAFAASLLLVTLVFRENAYCSSIIEIGAGQTVVGSGPYRFVRHPMYAAALLGTAALPLTLGSLGAEIFLPVTCGLFVMRILAEERFLSGNLPGYTAYTSKTRSRLVPGLW